MKNAASGAMEARINLPLKFMVAAVADTIKQIALRQYY